MDKTKAPFRPLKSALSAEVSALLLLATLLASCAGGGAAPAARPSDAVSAAQPTAQTTATGAVLPLGDGKLSDGPRPSFVFPCERSFPADIGAFRDGPWLRRDGTFDPAAKPVVDGAAQWPDHQLSITLRGDTRIIASNDLPDHPTGNFPIAENDDAYNFDRNPNRIAAQSLRYALPALPALAAKPSCLPLGPIGVMTSGSVIFNALDAAGRDAVAHEMQDACHGHPEVTSAYHYHDLSGCLADPGSGHSALLGYALDGFGIYGPRGEDGHELTNANLDACHGHTHAIEWDGKTLVLYHYHATREYPYTLGCFTGAPALVR